MEGDRDNFQLIKEVLRDQEGGLAIDFGANQGFYTYYLASLGMQVHSFEINQKTSKPYSTAQSSTRRRSLSASTCTPWGLS